ncbi:MAG TPA: hypothetical protein PLY93_06830, partial [Turneriella sp.]|nr:hypothetical protein [Turneriella sp.]
MQEFPDGKVGSQVSGKRILTRSLKVVGKILTYGLALSVVGVVVGYNYVMRPQFLEPLIVKQFATHTNGTIELKLEQTSLFRGFKFKNVIVRAPEEYSRTPILQAGEINLLYNVFGFFRGKFGVHEISLKNINIFIEQKKDVMNVQALLKPGKEKEPKEEIEKPESESSVISWFFDVQVFVRFALENFNFTLDARDASNKVKQYAHLKNFHFNFSVLSKDFNSIDTKDTASLVSLLNALVVELNPQKTIDVSYQGPAARITSPIDLSWLLFYDGMAKKPEFMSRMYVGQEKIPVALGARVAQNLSFLLQHKIEYNAKEDKLNVDHFLLKFLGDTVLSFSGSGEKLLTTKRKLQIQTHASRLNLGEVYRVVSTLTGKREPVYSGFFSVKPTRVSIDGNAIEDAGGLKLERVYARTRGLSISIPYLTFDHSASIVQGLKPLPVKRAEAKLAASLNGAPLNFTALLEEKKTAIDFSLRGFNITPFARSQAEGLVSTTLSAVGESPQALSLTLRVFSPQLYYFLDRGRSGLNRFDFTVKGTTRSSENFKQNSIYLPTILLTNKDKEYNSALFLKSRLQLEKAQTTKIVY